MSSGFDSQISLVETHGDHVLTLEGTIDALSAGELLTAARRSAEGTGRVILACSKLERLDTCALQVLLALRKTLSDGERPLEIVDLPEPVLDFLRVGGAEQLLLSAAEPAAQSAAVADESIANMTDTEIDGE
jgi:anti-anti-sigma factor